MKEALPARQRERIHANQGGKWGIDGIYLGTFATESLEKENAVGSELAPRSEQIRQKLVYHGSTRED
jgi:hypothetical protein